jgi:lysozyme
MIMLRNDVNKCVAELDKSIPWWRTLTPNRQAVLTNMCFNLGIGGLLGFNNTLAFIASGDWERAANGMLASKWAKQVGRRAIELSELMRKGK